MSRSSVAALTEPALGWPGWAHLRYCAQVELLLMALFASVYAATDWIAGLHEYRVRIHFDWELGIPLIAPLSVVYMSMNLMWPLAPFVIRTAESVRMTAVTIAFGILISGCIFVIVPATTAYPRPDPATLGIWAGWFEVACAVNLSYNAFPSLHVMLSAVMADALGRGKSVSARVFFTGWAIAVMASTVLAQQHHVIDVAGGLVVFLVSRSLAAARLGSLRLGSDEG